MIRGFVAKFSRQRLLARQCRLFAAETAPALGRTEQASEGGVMRYVNGELVKRNELALKKTEDIEGFVIGIVRDYFRTTNKAAVSVESTLEDHGLDSLDSIELSMRIEEELGYIISAETLPVLRKVKHYVNYIKQVEAFKEKEGKRPLQ